jgi:hypothetical protein
MTFNIKLKPKSVDLVPVHGAESDRMPSYLVYGGLVFSKLTIAYLGEYGEDWYNTAPRQLVYKALNSFQQSKDQEIVLLSHVLVDDCNYGYNSYLNIQLKKFNGVDVLNLHQLDQLIESTTSEFSRFDLDEFAYVTTKLSTLFSAKETLSRCDLVSTVCRELYAPRFLVLFILLIFCFQSSFLCLLLFEQRTIILNHKEAVAASPRIMENHGLPALKSKHFLKKPDGAIPGIANPILPNNMTAAAASAGAGSLGLVASALGSKGTFKL